MSGDRACGKCGRPLSKRQQRLCAFIIGFDSPRAIARWGVFLGLVVVGVGFCLVTDRPQIEDWSFEPNAQVISVRGGRVFAQGSLLPTATPTITPTAPHVPSPTPAELGEEVAENNDPAGENLEDAEVVEPTRRPTRVIELRRPVAEPSATIVPQQILVPTPSQTPEPAEENTPEPTPVPLETEPVSEPAAEPVTEPVAPIEFQGLLITTPVPRTGDTNAQPGGMLGTALEGPMFGGELPSFAAPGALTYRYVVLPGDTAWSVAIEMGIDLAEVPCAVAPDFSLDRPLVVGDTLVAPGLDVLCHQVQPGESPATIAAAYGLDVVELAREEWNRIPLDALFDPLVAGQFVRVPLGHPAAVPSEVAADSFFAFMLEQPVTVSPYLAYAVGGPRARGSVEPVPEHWPYGSGQFTWPVYGWLSQGYRNDHRALDIAAPPGTFITAADRGVVVRAGWSNQGYGRFVVIDHNIDYVTLYAHMEQILVREGDIVGQGQIIGTVGSTGNSTGPHLHFEIRDFGRRINPIDLLVR